jgi:hypothetical protein
VCWSARSGSSPSPFEELGGKVLAAFSTHGLFCCRYALFTRHAGPDPASSRAISIARRNPLLKEFSQPAGAGGLDPGSSPG